MAVILTVEDEFLVSDHLGEILTGPGHTVIAAFDADEAIAVLEIRNDVEIILTDITMPGSMDGLRLANAVRKRWPPIKIIVATGHAQPSIEAMPLNSEFLAKPYRSAPVLAAVSRVQQ
jgi:CheY-like chemotaxis protein